MIEEQPGTPATPTSSASRRMALPDSMADAGSTNRPPVDELYSRPRYRTQTAAAHTSAAVVRPPST